METGLETGSEIPRASIGEPHFDEEWAILDARPVVPLETIEAAKHRGLALRLVSAFVVAVTLGAVTALISIRLKQTPSLSSVETVAIADDKPGGANREESSESESAEVVELDDQPVIEGDTPKSAMLSQPKSVVRPVKHVHEVKTAPDPEPTINNSSKPQPVMVDQWQERRLRRVMRRERRQRRDQRNRDLIRIDELFEGQRPRQ